MTSSWPSQRVRPRSGWVVFCSVPAPNRRACGDRVRDGRHLMASGMLRKAMVYLGLTDDEFEDYDYEEAAPAPQRRYAEPEPAVSAVRPLGRDGSGEMSNGVT